MGGGSWAPTQPPKRGGGVLGTGTSWKKGGGGLKNWSCKKDNLSNWWCTKGFFWAYLLITLTFFLSTWSISGVYSNILKKRGLRHGSGQKRGVLGTGQARKNGGLGHGSGQKGGSLLRYIPVLAMHVSAPPPPKKKTSSQSIHTATTVSQYLFILVWGIVWPITPLLTIWTYLFTRIGEILNHIGSLFKSLSDYLFSSAPPPPHYWGKRWCTIHTDVPHI